MPDPPRAGVSGGNLITDVAGLRIGHAEDGKLASGVTVALFDEPAVASVSVAGGAPGGRDLECLEPDRTIERIDAIVLSGGSAFGLDAASGAQAWLRERGRGVPVREARVPIVPSAILFDLLNGGEKDWGLYPPYRELAYSACEKARVTFSQGSVGAGYGATTVDLKGGVGSASATTSSGHRVGALAVANSLGSAVIGTGPHFWAAPLEEADEFGGRGWPPQVDAAMRLPRWKGGTLSATTLALVATDAVLSKAQAKRLAIIAQGGLARALRLSHAAMDGDVVFVASTAASSLTVDPDTFTALGVAASDCVARSIARGIYEATALPFAGALPSWKNLFVGPMR